MAKFHQKKQAKVKIVLSVLICTVPSRAGRFLPKLLDKLIKQSNPAVEILYLGDNKKRTVGEKRNNLLELAQGDYVTFVDDDDDIADNYVPQLLHAITTGADVINFVVYCSLNGGKYKPVYYNANYLKDRNFEDHYERIPNHIMCVKRELALNVKFRGMNMGEDADYARRLKPLLKKQARIDEVLYYYNFSHQISETQ